MAEGLQYRGSLQLISGGYSPDSCPGCDWEIWGPAPGETPWIDTTGDSGSNTTTYYYRDSIQGKNANSTQVNVTVTDTWSATRLDDNSYRITVTTTIDSFNRVKYGSPDPLGAKIFIRQEKDGPLKWSSGSSCINAAIDATYQSPINIGSRTFTLAPGQSTQDLGTMYYRSNICGHDGDTPPSQWVDEYSMGIKFKNTLPPDYRPGQILDNNKIWQSHNRSGGAHGKNLINYPGPITGTITNYYYKDTVTDYHLEAGKQYAFSVYITSISSKPYVVTVGHGHNAFQRDIASTVGISTEGARVSLSFTAPDQATLNTYGNTFCFRVPRYSVVTTTTYSYKEVQLEEGPTATAYEPYIEGSGADNIYTGSDWRTMRTEDGAVGTDNPPYMRHTSEWKNQRKIGANK